LIAESFRVSAAKAKNDDVELKRLRKVEIDENADVQSLYCEG